MSKKRRSNNAVKAATLKSDRDVFGPWLPIYHFASKTEPVAMDIRTRMMVRLERSLRELRDRPAPWVETWRDMTDVVNFLQSLVELEWATDPEHNIPAAKLALERAVPADMSALHCKQLDEAGSLALRELLTQFEEIVRMVSAHSFWIAVKQTKTRVFNILRGGKRPGDVVVAI